MKVVAVLGAGTMGRGIAQVAAASGFTARLFDVSDEAARAGLAAALDGLARLESKGKISPEQVAAARGRLSAVSALEAAATGADVVIEAIPERLDLKRDLYARLEPLLAPTALLATNTSSIPIARLAEGLADPGRFLGLHFFNPVPLMRLLEIVVGPSTSAETLERARALAAALGKDAIVVRDAPGFASSRLGIALGMEAIRMLEEGVASAADIDRAMELGYAHPMGPLKLTDLVGLDVRLAIATALAAELGSRFAPPELLRRLVAEGRLGKKSGRGFYEWGPDGPRPADPAP